MPCVFPEHTPFLDVTSTETTHWALVAVIYRDVGKTAPGRFISHLHLEEGFREYILT